MTYARTLLALAILAVCPHLPAASTKAEQALVDIVETQKQLFADAEKKGDELDQENFRTQLQQLCQRYDKLLRESADFTSAYVAYGLLLNKAGMRKEAAVMFYQANLLDKNIPVVKNQLGNYLAEEGRPIEASNFFISAIKLDPTEPLYHFQLGTLLTEARDDFIKSGQYTRNSLDQAAHEAFRQATTLAPDQWRYAYGYGLSFYYQEKPDWAAALKFWQDFESKLKPGVEEHVAHLHQAKILIALGRLVEARSLLSTINDPVLEKQKAKVEAELAAANSPTSPTPSSTPAPSSAKP